MQLSDSERDAILEAAAPLPPLLRDEFEQKAIAELARISPDCRGPGVTFRVLRDVQREFLRGGLAAIGASRAKYASRM